MTARSYTSLKTPSENPVGQNRWRKEHAHLAGLHILDDDIPGSRWLQFLKMKSVSGEGGRRAPQASALTRAKAEIVVAEVEGELLEPNSVNEGEA